MNKYSHHFSHRNSSLTAIVIAESKNKAMKLVEDEYGLHAWGICTLIEPVEETVERIVSVAPRDYGRKRNSKARF